MRKISVVSALVLAILATIWAALPAFTFAFIPAILAILLGYYGLQLSKNKIRPKKTAELAILLSVLALILLAYKFTFSTSGIDNPQFQEVDQSVEENQTDDTDAFEELELKEKEEKDTNTIKSKF